MNKTEQELYLSTFMASMHVTSSAEAASRQAKIAVLNFRGLHESTPGWRRFLAFLGC
jgi:hypothetical protein